MKTIEKAALAAGSTFPTGTLNETRAGSCADFLPTRRAFLAALPVAIAAPVALAETVSPAVAAWGHWQALCASLEALAPAGCRFVILGGHGGEHSALRVKALRTVREEVRPGLTIPVERSAGEFELGEDGGWRAVA